MKPQGKCRTHRHIPRTARAATSTRQHPTPSHLRREEEDGHLGPRRLELVHLGLPVLSRHVAVDAAIRHGARLDTSLSSRGADGFAAGRKGCKLPFGCTCPGARSYCRSPLQAGAIPHNSLASWVGALPKPPRPQTPRMQPLACRMSSMTRDWLKTRVRCPSAVRLCSSAMTKAVLHDASAPLRSISDTSLQQHGSI